MYIYKNNNLNENVFKKWNLPIDYNTGSCHGNKKTVMENIWKSKEIMKK